jgi:transposase InsO family protein
MDLFGLVAYTRIGGSKYGLMVVDDNTLFTWVFFYCINMKPNEPFLKRAQNEFNLRIKKIRSDNGTKFNTQVEEYLKKEDIKHEFLAPYSLQQNGVVERKNQTLIDKARKNA